MHLAKRFNLLCAKKQLLCKIINLKSYILSLCLWNIYSNIVIKPKVDDRRALSGIVFVDRNGLRWRDAPSEYGPVKTLYNSWKRWGEAGVFTRMEGLAATGAEPQTIMIETAYLKLHRRASNLRMKKGILAA